MTMYENDLSGEKSNLFEDSMEELEFNQLLAFIKRYCFSGLGQEVILGSRPFDLIENLRNEHKMISEMIKVAMTDSSLPFEGLSDVRAKLHKTKIANAVLTSGEILSIRDVVRVSRLIKVFLRDRQENYPKIFELSAGLHENKLLEKHISEALQETGEVKDNASKELFRIRRQIFEKSNHLRSRLQKILKKVADEEMVMEEFISLREGRYVIPVKSEHKRHISGIIHGISQTGATVFLEPSEIIELNNELSLLLNEEKREIYRILQNLTGEIGNEASQFLYSVDILAHIDALFAKAKYALDFGGIEPEIADDNTLYLRDIRHPLLTHSKGSKSVIPLSIEFNDQIRGHLISGPNAGGKTVALKSIGISVAMALSGIFPLGICRTNFREIYTAIGDHQSIENDLSTFSSQILRLKKILSYCSPESLILVDEIGSGTDPQEGGALASGILDTFINLKAFFVATTHQSSLKTYALNRGEIDNASLEFDEQKLKPTYKFLNGIPGNSYAFFLAKNLGLTNLVLERARKYLGSRQKEIEDSIAILQKFKSEAEQEKMLAEKTRIEAERIKEKFNHKYDEIKSKRTQFIKEAQQEAENIITKANSLIENTIREIREASRPIPEIKKEYNKQKSEIEKSIKKEKEKKKQDDTAIFKAGNHVVLTENNTPGIILETDENESTALVDFNGLKFRIAFENLIHDSREIKPKTSSSSYITFDARPSLDLRGKRADEALKETDEFISDAILANLSLVTIIHGKGTGALRQSVHDLLKHHQSVKSYRLGELVEGGAGVTIVELAD